MNTASSAAPTREETLRALARRLVWWEPPEVAAGDERRLVVQAMVLGTWEDIRELKRLVGLEAFRAALDQAPPGVFDIRSWHYWHAVFGLEPVPALPVRKLC